jgi:glucose-1-phosphate thymidylyltransferase
MTSKTIKVVIPMAGLGTRLRPFTWSRPKQLISVAGKAVLDHVIDTLATLPDRHNFELVNIVGYLGEQIEDHIRACYPNVKSHFVVQDDPRGQSQAIWLAREVLDGPMLVVFADTLLKTDLSFLANEAADSVVWVKPVPDPRRFGVAEVDGNGRVKRLIEKPQDMNNNLAIVGFYYFKEAADLLSAIQEQMEKNIQLKGEFYLADAVNIMLQRGLNMRINKVDVWLDAGTPDAVLETNRYLLDHGLDNSLEVEHRSSVVLIPPVYVHPSADVRNAILGPHVSVGAGCRVENSIIKNTIVEDEAQTNGVILEGSLIGQRAVLTRRPSNINAGDNTELVF